VGGIGAAGRDSIKQKKGRYFYRPETPELGGA